MKITAEITNRRATTTFGRRPLPPGVESAVAARISVDGVRLGYVRLIGGTAAELSRWGTRADWAEDPVRHWLASLHGCAAARPIELAVREACAEFDEAARAYLALARADRPPLPDLAFSKTDRENFQKLRKLRDEHGSDAIPGAQPGALDALLLAGSMKGL